MPWERPVDLLPARPIAGPGVFLPVAIGVNCTDMGAFPSAPAGHQTTRRVSKIVLIFSPT